MYCRNCGTELKQNEKFCKNCGKATAVSDVQSIEKKLSLIHISEPTRPY